MQVKFIRIPFLIFFFFAVSWQVKATHIVGGEMNYRCLGNDQYEITMTVFRDCYNGVPNFDVYAKIGIFDANNNLVQNINDTTSGVLFIPYIYDDTINPTLWDPCLVVPPNVCVDVTTYTATVTLPYLPGGYNLVYQRCCRNWSIINIVNPLYTGATYNIEISEQALLECNSSAVFNEWPPTYVCVNYPIEFDHSATDIDGDSIVYRMCVPFHGAEYDNCIPSNASNACHHSSQPCGPEPCPPFSPPFDTVVWQSPFNVDNMLGGVPLTIDPQTGWLTGTPNQLGQFVVGICLDEYRDGNLISSTRRDFQYNVGDCGETISSFFAPEVQCDDLEVDFFNQSTNSDGYLWHFDLLNNPEATSTVVHPSYSYPDTGLYTVMLVAQPGDDCTDTSYHEVYLQYPTLTADFYYEQVGCTDSLIIAVSDLSYDTFSTIVAWEWELRSSNGALLDTSHVQDPTFVVTTSTIVTLELTVTAENGCTQFLSESFPVHIFGDEFLPDQLIACLGDSVELNPDPFLSAVYLWSPAYGLNDTTAANPLAFPEVTTDYSVFIVNEYDCEYFDTIEVVIIDDIPLLNAIAIPDTIYLGESSQLISNNDPGYTYQWFPSETLSNPSIFNPIATPEETTDYTVFVTNEAGCTNSATVRVVVTVPPCIEPHLFLPNAFTPNNDGENDVLRLMGNSIDVMYLVIYNRWGQKVFESHDQDHGWDGTFKGEALPPDVYGFYLEVKCLGGGEYFKKGNIALLK